jgi:hypothetical protein
MKGAIIFIIAFVIFLAATLAYPELPPGKQLYGLLGVQETSEQVLGIPATTLVCAIFNGVVYGVIIWLIFTALQKAGVIE